MQQGRNLQAIKDKFSGVTGEVSADEIECKEDVSYGEDDVSSDALDDMKESINLDLQGMTIKAYPALVRDGVQVNLRALDNQRTAEIETKKALRQLVVNALPDQLKHLRKSIPDIQNLCLKYTGLGLCEDLKKDIIDRTIDDVFLYDDIKTHGEFSSRIDEGKSKLHDNVTDWVRLLSMILNEYREIKKILKNPVLSQLDTVTDIQQQLNYLFPKHFITTTDKTWLQQYPRYLLGVKKRYEKAMLNAGRDREYRIEVADLWDAYLKRHESLQEQHIESDQLNHYRWMIEEYRVSLFAQELKTKFPVSAKRLKNYWNELSDA